MNNEIKLGDFITHQKFGEGKVVDVKDGYIWVDFAVYEIKKFSSDVINDFIEN